MTELDAGRRSHSDGSRRVPLLAPLGIRDFRFVWVGESVSLLGDQFNTVALAWLVLGITGSGFALGVILIASAIPRGLFMLIGGVLSDRISPRDLALASNILRAVLTTIVAGLVIGDRVELWQLAAVGVVFGTVDAVFLPAINTLVPRLVPAERLAAANGRDAGNGAVGRHRRAGVAGFAVALVGVGAAFAVDAAVVRVRGPDALVRPLGRTPAVPTARPAAHDAGSRSRRRRRTSVDPRRARRRRAGRPGRPGHALDRHPVDRSEPRLHRDHRGRAAVARARPLRRRRALARFPLRRLRRGFAGRRPRGGLTAASAPVRVDRARLRPHRGRRARGHRRRAVAGRRRRPSWPSSVRSTAGSTSSSSPGSRAGPIRRCSVGR